MNQAIEKKARIGVVWSILTTGTGQTFSFAIGVGLARLLRPEDFGVLAAIVIFTEVASTIISSGIVTALVQTKDGREEHYATALVLQLVLAIIAFLGLVAVSPWVGEFYRNGLVAEVLVVSSCYLLILPFISIPTAKLRKSIDFRSTGITEVVQQLSGGVVSLALAFLGWGVWSIVYGRLTGYAIKALQLAYMARWKPRFLFSRRALSDISAFSMKVTLVNILNDLASKVDFLMVGRLLSPAQLGFYSRAHSLMTLPLTQITTGMNIVFFSAFAEVQEDLLALKKGLLKATCYVSLITFPLLTGLFWVSPVFIHCLYGDQWMPTVLPLRIMCFAGMLLSIEPIAVSGITAKGYVGFEVKRQLIYLMVLSTGVFVGSYWGLSGVSFAVLLASICFMVLLQRLLKALLNIPCLEYIAAIEPALLSCGLMSVILFVYQSLAETVLGLPPFSALLSSAALGFVSYLGFLRLIRWRIREPIVEEVSNEIESYLSGALGKLVRLVRRPTPITEDN